MKQSFLIFLFFLTTSAYSAEISTTKFDSKIVSDTGIKKGVTEIGSNVLLNFSGAGSNSYSAYVTGGYFILDNIEPKITLRYSNYGSGSTIKVAPGIDYYFKRQNQILPFVGQDFVYSSSGGLSTLYGNTKFGALYLINDNIGFKVSTIANYTTEDIAGASLSLNGEFSIFW